MSDLILRTRNQTVALRLPRRGVQLACALLILCVTLTFASVMTGTYALSLTDTLNTMTGHAPSAMAHTVVFEFRLPRTLCALMAGALLGCSGALLQAMTRNPLADPSLVGVSQGASLAVVISIILLPEMPQTLRPIAAFVGAAVVAALIQTLSQKSTGGNAMRFILSGIGIAALVSAITSALLTYGRIQDSMSALVWLSGSIHSSDWTDVAILALATAAMVVVLPALGRRITALGLGDDMATAVGLNVRGTNLLLTALSVALAATAVSSIGPVGFVGLVAPHLARRLTRSSAGLHLLLTALVGALMVATADLTGRLVVAPLEIPAGLITALIGVPVFLALILRRG